MCFCLVLAVILLVLCGIACVLLLTLAIPEREGLEGRNFYLRLLEYLVR